MGCSGSKDTGPKFEDIVLGTPAPVDASLSVDGIISKQGQVVAIKATAMMSKKTEYTDKATGEVLFTTEVISTMNKEGALLRADGTRVAVSFGKMTGVTTKELSIERSKPAFQGQPASDKPASDAKDVAVYPFAKISAKEMGGSTCTYSIVDSSGAPKELYKGKRDFGLKEQYLISTVDDVPVAKITKINMMGTDMEAELAPGVDICAVMAMCNMLAPGGNAAGGLAGAGVV